MPSHEEPRLESYLNPDIEELTREHLHALFMGVQQVGRWEQFLELAPSRGTIQRIAQNDPTVMHSTKVKAWRAAAFTVDHYYWEQRHNAESLAGVRKPPSPVHPLELAIFDALWLSVRTIPCQGALHVYGRPHNPGLYPRILMASGGQVEDDLLERLAISWSVCPLNGSSRHIPDGILSELAQRVGLTHNIWRDALRSSPLTVVD